MHIARVAGDGTVPLGTPQHARGRGAKHPDTRDWHRFGHGGSDIAGGVCRIKG